MYIARRSVLPRLPQSLIEVFDSLEELQPKTSKDEDFLTILDRQNRIVIFSWYTNLRFLCSVNIIYMDGAFEYCTKFFQQLYTIHAFKNGYYVPVVFALLPSKTMEVYTTLLCHLTAKCTSLGFIFQPREVAVDFEQAVHNATLLVWPTVNIIGCRFHLCQAWYKKFKT